MQANDLLIPTNELHHLVESWQLPADEGDRLYPVNTVVDAYLRGKNDGMEQTNKLLKKQLQDNFSKAAQDTSKVVEFLKAKGIESISAHLKVWSLYDLSILITISELDFLKDVFSEVYNFTNHIEQIEKSDLYSISFSFVNKSDQFNTELLRSDGFILSLKELQSK